MNERIVKVVCTNAHYDFQVGIHNQNGYQLISSKSRLEFHFFGKPVHELVFFFNPSDEVIQRWIDGLVENENYEAAATWRDVLIKRNIDRRKNGNN